MNGPNDILKMALSYMEKTISPVTLSAWFDDAEVVTLSGDRLVIRASGQFKKEIIESRFLEPLSTAVAQLLGGPIQISVILGDETPVANTLIGLSFEDEYTFEHFIVGSSNKFAHAAAIAVANSPAENYNPLFIYGQSGLGKTHLLHAIGNVVHQNHPNFRIIYVKGEDFTNELVTAIQEGDVQSFRGKYRVTDLLLIDDIQFIAGKERTQEEFFHTFNALYESGKQLVLTSDRPPKEMNTLEDRMKTRFEWGLPVDIQPPDYETRVAIIKNKAIRMGMELPDYIIQLIAETITANVRQIEGTVNKIMAYQDINGDKVDKNTVIRAVKDIFKEKSDILPTADVIIDEVCKFYNLEPGLLRGQGRSKDISLARQIAMYQIRRMTNLSLKEIGHEFNRDHSTVLSALNRIEGLVKTDPEKAEIIKDITTNINSRYE